MSPAGRERELLRARVFLRAVVPLLEVVLEAQPELARSFRGVTADVQLAVANSDVGACLRFAEGRLRVEQGVRAQAQVRVTFRNLAALNAFFAGKPTLPRLQGLLHPVLIAKVTRLLLALQILHPQARPGSAAERALRVRLLLYLVSRALAELHHGGHPEMRAIVEASPERVYQWSVTREGIASYLRMERGRVRAGRGAYERRQPFVHWVFPDVDAALTVLTASGSQVDGVRQGLVQTLGSPEYTRKLSLMMQKVDELMVEG